MKRMLVKHSECVKVLSSVHALCGADNDGECKLPHSAIIFINNVIYNDPYMVVEV